MKRPRAPAARDVEGACFLAWLDAPSVAGAPPALCVGELHFSNASHLPRGTPVDALYGVLFQLRARADGAWTHDGGYPWRVVPMGCTVAARLGAATADGLAWPLANAVEAAKRLEEMGEVAAVSYEPEEQPEAAAVVGAPRLPLPALLLRWLTRCAAHSGPRRVAGVRREAQRCGAPRSQSA
jgi:hypothetical protein